MKKVYVGMSADLVHPGHINIIKEASKLFDALINDKLDMKLNKRLPKTKEEELFQLKEKFRKERNELLKTIESISKIISQAKVKKQLAMDRLEEIEKLFTLF